MQKSINVAVLLRKILVNNYYIDKFECIKLYLKGISKINYIWQFKIDSENHHYFILKVLRGLW